jgi:hypothetical protein
MNKLPIEVQGVVAGGLEQVSHVSEGAGVSFNVLSDKVKDWMKSGEVEGGDYSVAVQVFGELAEVVKARFSRGLSKDDVVQVGGAFVFDSSGEYHILADRVEFAS